MGRLTVRIHLEVFIAIILLGMEVACIPNLNGTDASTTELQTSEEPIPGATETIEFTASPTLRAIVPILAPPDGQLLRNADFESGTGNWDTRFGDFLPTIENSYTGMGSGRLITSSLDARGDYTALVGQCVPLGNEREVTGESGTAHLQLSVYINTSAGGTYISLSGVFTDDDRCRGAQVGTFSIPVDPGEGWIAAGGVINVPAGAGSLDLLISCSGDGPDASILVDDVHLSPADPPLTWIGEPVRQYAQLNSMVSNRSEVQGKYIFEV